MLILDGLLQSLQKRNPGKSGAYVLEKGKDSLMARAWLGDHAQESIDIQYFIWSTDNIGVLASEAMIRAAKRGVRVRILVDDFRVDASPENLLTVDSHPLIEIRIYNPKISVGTSLLARLFNMAKDFRGFNQRMHDKAFIIDGHAAITGGRNMADKYYGYNHRYNYRDRDVLLVGPVVKRMQQNFEIFWNSPLSMPIEKLLKKKALKRSQKTNASGLQNILAYGQNPQNFPDDAREELKNLPERFSALAEKMVWDDIEFICDVPGKNERGWYSGGDSTRQLQQIVQNAKSRIVIQTPYLILQKKVLELFKTLVARGVQVHIVTNSLAAIDNPFAFGGYSKQRRAILEAGIDVYEYRPNPLIAQSLHLRNEAMEQEQSIFAIHAKTMVVDGKVLFLGSFNLDPRSANLNTEVGILISNSKIAGRVERAILDDMHPNNSWNARSDNPDSFAPWSKRLSVWFLRLLPLEPLL